MPSCRPRRAGPDRFGALPGPVENLVFSLRGQAAAQAAGIRRCSVDEGRLTFEWRRPTPATWALWPSATAMSRLARYDSFDWRGAGAAWQEELIRVLSDPASAGGRVTRTAGPAAGSISSMTEAEPLKHPKLQPTREENRAGCARCSRW